MKVRTDCVPHQLLSEQLELKPTPTVSCLLDCGDRGFPVLRSSYCGGWTPPLTDGWVCTTPAAAPSRNRPVAKGLTVVTLEVAEAKVELRLRVEG